MYNKFVGQNGLKLVNTVFEDYLGTQFFPSLKLANDNYSQEKIESIYSTISENNSVKNLYIHIPFCKTRCSYCHCYTSLEEEEQYEKYIAYLLTEIELVVNNLGKKISLDSIFIGGGTPNIISANLLDKLLKKISDSFDLTKIKQYNIDLNPYFLDLETIQILSQYGVNRCTYAIQSFDENILKANSRFYKQNVNHQENIKNLRKNGILVNIDLMVGITGQTLETCISDIEIARKLNSDNISLNYFIQSSNTYYKIDEEQIELISKVKKYYNNYIYKTYNQDSNYQEENYLANKVDLIGIGNGSISHIYGKLICYNMGKLNDYYDDIDNHSGNNKKIKYLTIKDEMIKFIWLNLIYKIDRKRFKYLFGKDIVIFFKEEMEYLESKKIVKISDLYIEPLVSNFKLYLYLSILLKEYLIGANLDNNFTFQRDNIKSFFLKNGEKIDEDF